MILQPKNLLADAGRRREMGEAGRITVEQQVDATQTGRALRRMP
jgi:hypothetical protein